MILCFNSSTVAGGNHLIEIYRQLKQFPHFGHY